MIYLGVIMNNTKSILRFLTVLLSAGCIALLLPLKSTAASSPYKIEAAQQISFKQANNLETGWKYNKDTRTLRIKNEPFLFVDKNFYHETPEYLLIPFEGTAPWNDADLKIEKVTIDEGVKKLPLAIFSYLSDLKEVTLPSTLTELPKYAFYHCSSLEKVVIPDSITHIGFKAFFECNNLREISIGKGVKSIDINTFGNCTSLEKILVSSDNLNFSAKDGILYDKKIKTLVLAPSNSTNSVTIPNTVKTIGSLAFANCVNLKQIRIPYQVKEISDGAFYNCTSLKSVSFAKNSKCKKINDYTEYNKRLDEFALVYGAFENCKSLTTLTFPDSLETIGYFTLNNCSSLKSIHFGSNFKSLIYKNAPLFGFAYTGHKNLATITVSSNNKTYTANNGILFNKSKTRLYWYPQNKKDKTFIIPKKVKIIERNAFQNNKHLKQLNLSSVETIKIRAFSNCLNLENIQWSKNLKLIGSFAFDSCEKLKSYTSSKNNVEIYDSAFNDCISLKKVTLKYGTRYIGDGVFSNCFFEKVTIPSSVMTLGKYAFAPNYKIAKKFTIYCKKDSAAYWFAKKNKFKYVYY